MKVGIIGLGKIGSAVAQRLVNAGHEVIGFDQDQAAMAQAKSLGVSVVTSLSDIPKTVRVLWLYVPAGSTIDIIIASLVPDLKPGDIIIDGGNSKFTDSMRRATMLAPLKIFYLDCGTSGGLQGGGNGFCLMVGGDPDSFTKIRTLFEAVAAPGGLAHVGPSGAGHYVKMVHNGIEYGLLQAYAEGMQLIKEGSFKNENLDLEQISRIWQHGSIIRSWILELTHNILARDQKLEHVIGQIEETGTGRWAVEDAQQHDITMPLLQASLDVREKSRQTGGNYATKLIALMRHEFGGHPFKEKH